MNQHVNRGVSLNSMKSPLREHGHGSFPMPDLPGPFGSFSFYGSTFKYKYSFKFGREVGL